MRGLPQDSPEVICLVLNTLQGRVCDFMLSTCSWCSSEVILESMYIHVQYLNLYCLECNITTVFLHIHT